jgi:hypothetical protein
VHYEPDGNIPPDFSISGNIAIEARRLNQHYFDGTEPVGLEENSIPLWIKLKKLITKIGPAPTAHSWYVYCRFNRPIKSWKAIEKGVVAALERFAVIPDQDRGTIATIGNFEIDVFPARICHTTMFVFGGLSDEDSGGWLIYEMERNIQYCLREKTKKISCVRANYKQWWLALVDHIGYGLDEFDRELFGDQVSIIHNWDRVILIDPRDHTRWFEI